MTLSRLSLAILSVLAGAPAFADDSGVDLDQGWNQTQKTAWLEAGQGSRMLPLAWLVALEQRASEEPLMSDALIRQYGYVPHTLGGSSVKVVQGYAVDRSDDSDLTFTKLRWKALQGSREPWVGPTCSMCHTSHISYQGTQLTVYGGQTMGDLAGFQLEILGALQSTRADTAKFERFARKVLGADGLVSGYNDANKARLQAALDATIVRLRDGSHFNLPHDPEFGPGRLDAIGSIFNSVGYELHADQQIYGAEDAPVSYPFLWNVPQLDRVQWTGFNPNHINVVDIDNRKFDVGALARNAGEAVGVFADVKVLSPIQSALHIGYPSSINVDNLIRIEDQLGQLKPPAWPNQLFGAPEPTRVAEGRELYRQHCSSCHTPLDRNDLRTPVKTVLTHLQARGEVAPIGTDPWTACNSIAQLKTGYVRGKPYLSFVGTGQRGFYGKQAYAVDVLQEVVVQALAARGLSVALGAFQTAALGIFDGQLPPLISPVPDSPDAASAEAPAANAPGALLLAENVAADSDKARRLEQCLAMTSDLMAYKARPLNGIWASPPYLHNGSVATLYDLLLPPDLRPRTFYTGSVEFDPVNVGYITDALDEAFELGVAGAKPRSRRHRQPHRQAEAFVDRRRQSGEGHPRIGELGQRQRQEGEAVAAGDLGQENAQVVRPHAAPGREGGGIHRIVHELAVGGKQRVLRYQQRLADQVVQRPVGRQSPVQGFRQGDDVLVAADLHQLVFTHHLRRRADDRRVQGRLADQAEQVQRWRPGWRNGAAHPRFLQLPGQLAGPAGIEVATETDVQLAVVAVADVAGQRLGLGDDLHRAAMHHPAHLGQAHPGRTADEQRLADVHFERLDLPRQRRLRNVQHLGGLADAAVLGDTGEIHQLAQRRHRLRPVDDWETGIGHGHCVHTPRWQHGSDRHGQGNPGTARRTTAGSLLPKAVSRQKNER